MTIMTKDREQVKKIALGRAGWCYVQGSKGGEYVVSNANGKLIVMKPGIAKIIKATKELKIVLYTDILVDDTPAGQVATGGYYKVLERADNDTESVEENSLQEVDCNEKTTENTDLQELEHLVSVYDDYVRSGDFQTVLFKNEKGWCIQSSLYEDSDTFSHHLPRFKSILQTDEKALFLNAVDGDRFPDDMTDYEIAAVLFDMYEKQENLLSDWLKQESAPKTELSGAQQESETVAECGDTLTEKERAIASLLPVVEAYETALRSKYHSVILYKDAESWNAEIVGVNPVKREWATFQDKEKALRILADHRDAVLMNGFENGLGDECNTLEVIAGLLYWEYTTQAHSLSRLISQYTLPKETINPQESDKKHTITKPDTEKASEQPDAVPWMEHIKRLEKAFAELAERWAEWLESMKKRFPCLFPDKDSSSDSTTTTDNKYSTCFVPVSADCTAAPGSNRRQAFGCNNRARPPPD